MAAVARRAAQLSGEGAAGRTAATSSSPTALADVLEPRGRERFLLHGRTADLVNIAGKRSSLAYLNHQLQRDSGRGRRRVLRARRRRRLARRRHAAGRAGGRARLDAARILQALRERIDPVFLPRPLLLVDALPRNATGKLPQQTLRALVAQAAARAAASVCMNARVSAWLRIAPDHPALAGHFPGHPIVPGVLLLDEALHAHRARDSASAGRRWRIASVKFHRARAAR